ncbi:MAG: DMT family transporter, partial [Syntrophales bacterium]|nr:DMT family transporter [Syntrophales bacterium]
ALAMGSSLIWALFWLFNVRDRRDEVVKLFSNFCFGRVFVAVTAFILSPPRLPDLAGLMGAIYIGAFEMGITYVFWLKALTLSRSAALVSNIVYASPFLSLFLIRFIVGEVILPSTLVGLVLIVTGILIQQGQKSVD